MNGYRRGVRLLGRRAHTIESGPFVQDRKERRGGQLFRRDLGIRGFVVSRRVEDDVFDVDPFPVSVPHDLRHIRLRGQPDAKDFEFLCGRVRHGRFFIRSEHLNPRPPNGNRFGTGDRHGNHRGRAVRPLVFRRNAFRMIRYARRLERIFRIRVRMFDFIIGRMNRLRLDQTAGFANLARNPRFAPPGFQRKPQNLRLRDNVFGPPR